jgi:hypothetical protein
LAEAFPEHVVRFLDGNIESIDQLEILRVLGEDPARNWSAESIASEIQAKVPDTVHHLAALQSRGLIVTDLQSQTTFARYGPRDPAIATVLDELLRLYRERPVSMIKLVYARAADPLRSFVDAFRLRKEGD